MDSDAKTIIATNVDRIEHCANKLGEGWREGEGEGERNGRNGMLACIPKSIQAKFFVKTVCD